MLGVNQGGEGRGGTIVPAAGRGFTSGILGGGDDFEILVLELGVEFLPAWQIVAAASPGGPGYRQHLLTAEIGEVDGAAFPVGYGEIRSHPGAVEIAANHRHLAKAPNPRFMDAGLMEALGKAGEIEPGTALQYLRNWNAHVGAAGALRLQCELVDAGKIAGSDPKVLGIRTDLGELDGPVIIEHSHTGGRRGERARGSGGGQQKLSAVHSGPVYRRMAPAVVKQQLVRLEIAVYGPRIVR
jgi:hypothetical protein